MTATPNLGENLRLARRAAGLGQEEVAERLALTRGTVSNHERGVTVPDDAVLRLYAALYKTPVAELRYGDLRGTTKARDEDVTELVALLLDIRPERDQRFRIVLQEALLEFARLGASASELSDAQRFLSSKDVLLFYAGDFVKHPVKDPLIVAFTRARDAVMGEFSRRQAAGGVEAMPRTMVAETEPGKPKPDRREASKKLGDADYKKRQRGAG